MPIASSFAVTIRGRPAVSSRKRSRPFAFGFLDQSVTSKRTTSSKAKLSLASAMPDSARASCKSVSIRRPSVVRLARRRWAALPLLIACRAIDQEGCLCLRGRDRISQLVGAVGGKGTLGFQRRAQSDEKAVHITDDRRKLNRQPITGDRRQVRAVATFNSSRKRRTGRITRRTVSTMMRAASGSTTPSGRRYPSHNVWIACARSSGSSATWIAIDRSLDHSVK
jgi:hypothetical protein